MTQLSDLLPVSETLQVSSDEDVVTAVADAAAADTPLYPVGGGTSLNFGLPATDAGQAIDLSGLQQVVDYPARDMTITVQSGTTLRQLAGVLGGENQQLPCDAPQPDRATIGGLVATNFNGPRRYGHGALRDFVIGISAVDGHGRLFRGGGRVVKNVAGYDFCKLLTGSLGTLGIITQLTLRLKPIAERAAWLACGTDSVEAVESLLEALGDLEGPPVAMELLGGPAWDESDGLAGVAQAADFTLLVRLEGTEPEVAWLSRRIAETCRTHGAADVPTLEDNKATGILGQLTEFPADEEAALVLQANIVPSAVVGFVQAARELSADCSFLAHAGNGTVLLKFPALPDIGLSSALVGRLRPLAAAAHGRLIVLSNPAGSEMTHQIVWGGLDVAGDVMREVKRHFDPKNLLNRGRFVY